MAFYSDWERGWHSTSIGHPVQDWCSTYISISGALRKSELAVEKHSTSVIRVQESKRKRTRLQLNNALSKKNYVHKKLINITDMQVHFRKI